MAAAANGIEDTATVPDAVPATQTVPLWLEASIFEDLLKDMFADFVKIKEFKAEPALAAGENYATVMLQVEIKVELAGEKTKTINLVMKVPHDNDFARQMLEIKNIFHVESGMYKEIVPQMETMYRNAGLDIQFGAQAYYLKNNSNDYVLLEDLRPRGFKNANRLEGLDMEHTKCVLKKLAQWHAASATRVETLGKYSDLYATAFFTENSRPIIETTTTMLSKFILQCMETYKDNEVYIDDVKKLQAKQVDMIMKYAKNDASEFNVLNHGDCWSNNVMFQYDAFGKIKQTFFIDFQMPKYGSPAQDLFYFIISSTKYEIKLKEFDYFIKYYHDQLIEHLILLKYPKKLPTLSEIHAALYKYGLWGFLTATGVMAAVLLDPSENAVLDNFISDTDLGTKMKLQMFSNPRYRKHIEAILPWLHNRGALEI